MARKFYNEELEQLIKEKADQYKMYPSEKVWRGIYRSLHSSRRWYWLGFILFFAGLGYYAIDQLTTSGVKKSITQTVNNPTSPSRNADKAIVVPFTSLPPATRSKSLGQTQRHLIDATLPREQKNTSHIGLIAQNLNNREQGLNKDDIDVTNRFEQPLAEISVVEPANIVNTDLLLPFRDQNVITTLKEGAEINASSETSADNKKINWLQEYAVYELKVPALKRLSWQFSFSPTMNYRKLMGNKNARIPSEVKNVPIALNIQGELDRLVNHKPALGFELGSHLLYSVSKNLTLKGGIQFNYSRYEIQAYTASSSEMATIALNNFSGVDNDSITSYTSLRNFGGEEVKDISNQYFQISAPVGAEFVIMGNKKIQFAFAGTIQPTYLLNRNTYLITTDYKNYTHEPSLVRKWNVNTSAEAFISYKAAGVKWQIGPQFRYQILSTYSNKYPIKEHLMEYGIKVGVSKTIR